MISDYYRLSEVNLLDTIVENSMTQPNIDHVIFYENIVMRDLLIEKIQMIAAAKRIKCSTSSHVQYSFRNNPRLFGCNRILFENGVTIMFTEKLSTQLLDKESWNLTNPYFHSNYLLRFYEFSSSKNKELNSNTESNVYVHHELCWIKDATSN